MAELSVEEEFDSVTASFDRHDESVDDTRDVLGGRYELGPLRSLDVAGRIYQAYDLELQQHVAIRVWTLVADEGDRSSVLAKQARVLTRLHHPNVVAASDVGGHGGRLFVVTEVSEDPTLDQWLAIRPRSWREVLAVMRQVAEGLAAAHEAGVVHRGFRPGHVTVDTDGRPRVTAFGVAPEVGWSLETDNSNDTTSGSLPTLADAHPYAAPEQLDGSSSPSVDQFAFCTALFEAVTGHRPWRSSARGIRPGADADALRRLLRAHGAPRWLWRVIRRGLAHEPEARFGSMRALCSALDRVSRARATMLGVLAAGLGVLVVARAGSVEPCGGATRMDAVWSGEARASLMQQLGGAGASSVLLGTVDEAVAAWNDASARSCMAHRSGEISAVLHEQRRRCLDRTAARTRYALDQIGRGAYSTRRIAATLTPAVQFERCDDDERLESWGRHQHQTDTDLALFDEMERGIDRAYVQLDLGNEQAYFEALENLYRSHAVRVDGGYTAARVARQYSTALARRGALTEAAEVVEDALSRLGDEPEAVVAAAELQSALAVALSADPARATDAQRRAELAIAVIASHGFTAGLAPAHIARARAAAHLGNRVAAYDALNVLRELIASSDEATWDGFERNRLELAVADAEIRARLGRVDEAVRRYNDAIAELRIVGAYPRLLAQALNNVGDLMSRRGDVKAASLVEEAAGLKHAIQDHHGAALSWMTAGTIHLRAGRGRRAIEAYREALTALPSSHPAERFEILYNLGLAYQADADGALAREALTEARELSLAAGLADSELRFNVEVALLQLSVAERSPQHEAELALASVRRHAQPRFSAYTRAEVELAACSIFESSDPEAARRALERAQPLVQEARDPDLRDAMRACRSRLREG